MPIYEYRCKACGEKFDKLVRMSTRDKDIECPRCGKRKAEKIVSLPGGPTSSELAGPACGPST